MQIQAYKSDYEQACSTGVPSHKNINLIKRIRPGATVYFHICLFKSIRCFYFLLIPFIIHIFCVKTSDWTPKQSQQITVLLFQPLSERAPNVLGSNECG